MIGFRSVLLAMSLVSFAGLPIARAEDPNAPAAPTPTPREVQLELEKRIATLEADIAKQQQAEAEAEAAERKAQPGGAITGLTGGLTLEGDFKVEGAVLAYREVEENAPAVAAAAGLTCPKKPTADDLVEAGKHLFVLYSPNDAELLAIEQIPRIENDLKAIAVALQGFDPRQDGPTIKKMSPAEAAAALRAAAEVASLLKTESKIKGFDLTLDLAAVDALLARALTACGAQVSIVRLSFASGPSNLINLLNEARNAREVARAKLEPFRARAAGETNADAKKRLEARLAEVNADFARLELPLAALLTELAAKDTTGASRLDVLLKAERFKVLMTSSTATSRHWVSLGTLVGGGSTRVTNSLFTNPQLFFSGGAVVSYTLVEPNGTIRGAGVLTGYSGFERGEKIAGHFQWPTLCAIPLVGLLCP